MTSKATKITASVILELGQLDRLNEAAKRAHVSRSVIVRDAIERELRRYEEADERKGREKEALNGSNTSSATP